MQLDLLQIKDYARQLLYVRPKGHHQFVLQRQKLDLCTEKNYATPGIREDTKTEKKFMLYKLFVMHIFFCLFTLYSVKIIHLDVQNAKTNFLNEPKIIFGVRKPPVLLCHGLYINVP